MKIQKEFAPITITIETIEDLKDLKQMLYAAVRATRTWSGIRDVDTANKVEKFLKDLGMPL
jgi:hypothetical protein